MKCYLPHCFRMRRNALRRRFLLWVATPKIPLCSLGIRRSHRSKCSPARLITARLQSSVVRAAMCCYRTV